MMWNESRQLCPEGHAKITGIVTAHNVVSLAALLERIEAEQLAGITTP